MRRLQLCCKAETTSSRSFCCGKRGGPGLYPSETVLQIRQSGRITNRNGRTRLLYNVAPHATSARPIFELAACLIRLYAVLRLTLRCNVMRVRGACDRPCESAVRKGQSDHRDCRRPGCCCCCVALAQDDVISLISCYRIPSAVLCVWGPPCPSPAPCLGKENAQTRSAPGHLRSR